VWLSAHQGIVHIPEGEVEHVIREPSYKVKYETFDQLSDLPDPLQAAVALRQRGSGYRWLALVCNAQWGRKNRPPENLEESACTPGIDSLYFS